MQSNPALGIVILIVAAGLYFLPCIISGVRDKAHGGFGIFLLNLLLGWTVIGWFAALIWASSGTTKGEQRAEQRRHAELIAALRGAQPGEPAIGVRPDQLRNPSLARPDRGRR